MNTNDSMTAHQSAQDGAPDPLGSADVIIVGTGFAGLGMGAQLRRRGRTSFVLLERAQDVGGTWRDNHYPGAACDVPSHLYSFSFRKNPEWSRTFSPQPEILRYLRDAAHDEGLMPHIRFGAELLDARWDGRTGRWTVSTPRGTFTGKVLITAAGHLSDPKRPAIPGLDSFTGRVFHSAEWDHGCEVAGKRVGVVGSGASAVQIVPALAGTAAALTVFQRSAPYVTPRHDRAYSEIEKSTFRRLPERIDALRAELFWTNESRFVERQAVPTMLARISGVALAHLNAQVSDPVLRQKLTPDYQIGCKRILKSDDYYPALCRPDVTLETGGIARVEGDTVITEDGGRHRLDVLVLATGFEASDLPIAHRITGEDGVLLADQWRTGMQAYATTAVHGFPNLFIMNGPNSGLGHNSVVYVIESQTDYILGALEFMGRENIGALVVSAEAEEEYARGLDGRGRETVWMTGGCRTWYVDPRNGRLTTLWPDFAHAFREENSTFEPGPYTARRTPGPGTVPTGRPRAEVAR